MERIHIIKRGHVHLDTIAPVVTITRSADPAITRDIARTVKLLEDIGVAAVIRERNTKIAAITAIVGMNLDPVNHTDLKLQGSNQSPEDLLNGP
jgi:hypothetical protein